MSEGSDASASCAQLRGFGAAEAWPAAVVDVVLSQPGVECDGADTEILRGLLDLAALAHESDGTSAELRRIQMGPSGEPSMKTADQQRQLETQP